VTTVAVPVVCLAPVVTIASLSRVPTAAVRLVRHAPNPETPAARGVPFPIVADAPPAPRSSTKASAAPRGAVAADGAAVPEIALDEPVPAAPSEPVPSAAVLEAVAAAAAPATPLRDAVAAARIPPEPAPSRTRFDEPDLERRVWKWIRGERLILSFDPQRPRYELR
jgi:hypothetical protein